MAKTIQPYQNEILEILLEIYQTKFTRFWQHSGKYNKVTAQISKSRAHIKINAWGQTPLSANVILPGNLKICRLVNDSLPISEVITQELYFGSEKFWCLLQQPFLHPFRFWHPFSIDLNIKSNNNAKCKFTFSSIFCTMVHKMSRCHVSGIGCMQ